ncbi:MAG: outer membrane protein assembly factor BamD [Deltaproteobacteria bacterium]|nr:outer membrane protein assembly factor BamD [Deltaproteobacteria bacterium]
MKHNFAIIYLVIAAFAAGCSSISLPSLPWSSQPVQSNPAVEALFAEGMDHFKNKRYARAIDRFQRVKAEFPFSPQLTEAELRLAEAYYLNKQYPEAIAAFKEFQTLHPTNENIPLVLYHLGMAHFDQFTSIDRDQKVTEIARGYFETLVKNHSSSPYAEKAREKLAKAEQYLAEHEFNIARFYFNEKNYPAARDRFQDILRRYPNNPTAPQTLYYLGESYRLEKNTVKAGLAYEALTQHYPQSPLAKQAETQLAQLDKQKVDPLTLLLMPDGRPRFVPPPSTAPGTVDPEQSRRGQSSIVNRKPEELNLVAKTEVVHEEPGPEKGLFRRVADTVNPFNWFSSSDDGKKEAQKDRKTATAQKESPKPDPAASRELLAKVDESLKQQAIETGSKNPPTPTPPAAELPKATDEPSPRPSDTAAILATVDARLEKEGKQVDQLPPTPEIAPVLQASAPEQTKTGALKGDGAQAQTAASSAPTRELLAGIDEALKRKGIEAPKAEQVTKGPESPPGTGASAAPAPRPASQAKVELAPRLPAEKGPLFLDTGEFQVKEKADKKKEEATEEKAPKPVEQPKSLPQSVVKSPTQPEAIKPAEKKKPEAEEERSAFDQLKEDFKSLGSLLNPFNW